jgi:NMD protein affecting ribosome stability and mRNA decay
MTRANSVPLRLSSEVCSTCNELHVLKARIEDAHRNAGNLYSAAMKATDSTVLQNLEEELKQTSAAHNLVCYAIDAHLADQHSHTHGVRWAA